MFSQRVSDSFDYLASIILLLGFIVGGLFKIFVVWIVWLEICVVTVSKNTTGYVSDVFSDASLFMRHSGRQDLNLEDVRLAIQSRVNYSFTDPPPIEFLLEVANKKNAESFGFIPERPSVLLPPPQHCLTEINYQLQPTTTTTTTTTGTSGQDSSSDHMMNDDTDGGQVEHPSKRARHVQ